MVRTRAQSLEEAGGPPAKPSSLPKRGPIKKRTETYNKLDTNTPKKRKVLNQSPSSTTSDSKSATKKRPSTSKSTAPESKSETSGTSAHSINSTISKLFSTNITVPLSNLGLPEPLNPTSSTALAHIFNALLSSTRISHNIAANTLSHVVDAGYCDLETLQKSTWEERTEVLTKGGYTHYREKTATALGDIAAFVEEHYGGDAARIITGDESEKGLEGEEKRKAVASRLKDIKGLGKLGIELFMETAQGIWTPLSPFVAERNLKALKEMGVKESVDDIYIYLGNDARSIARLCAVLAKVRLEGRIWEFAQAN